MYPVRTSLPRWGITVALALILSALWVAPTLAGEEEDHEKPALILGHSVSSGSSTFVGFGPAGPKCNGTTVFDDCTFFTTTFKGTGDGEPGGPFTFTGTGTAFFGKNGSALTVNGAVNPDGTPAGVCDPTFNKVHIVQPNGTIDTVSKGEVCCAGASCGPPSGGLLGPPTTAHDSSVCISGTGKFVGIQCSNEDTSSSADGVHFIGRSEGVSTK